MKQMNYTGSSKLKSRIAYLLNRKAPLPLDGDGDPDWGTNGQVLSTDGSGNTAWVNAGGGGDSVSWTQDVTTGTKIAEIDINGTTTDVYAPSAGSGGHTIENTSGTDLPQEDNLQFVGVYTRDDSGNDRTEVNIVRDMTAAQMAALSTAEAEGFIWTNDEDDIYAAIDAEDVKYGGSDVKTALDSINATISGGSRTVTTLVNETASIAAGGSKTYATLTSSALSAYDEIWIYAEYGNVASNGSASKAQIAAAASYGGGTGATINFLGYVLESSGTLAITYSFAIKPLSTGLTVYNRSVSSTIGKLLIEGIKYN